MNYKQEDINKIKQLIKSTDDTNIKLGCILAINTLGMTIDELIDLIDESDVIENNDERDWKYLLFAFGDVWYSDEEYKDSLLRQYNFDRITTEIYINHLLEN